MIYKNKMFNKTKEKLIRLRIFITRTYCGYLCQLKYNNVFNKNYVYNKIKTTILIMYQQILPTIYTRLSNTIYNIGYTVYIIIYYLMLSILFNIKMITNFINKFLFKIIIKYRTRILLEVKAVIKTIIFIIIIYIVDHWDWFLETLDVYVQTLNILICEEIGLNKNADIFSFKKTFGTDQLRLLIKQIREIIRLFDVITHNEETERLRQHIEKQILRDKEIANMRRLRLAEQFEEELKRLYSKLDNKNKFTL